MVSQAERPEAPWNFRCMFLGYTGASSKRRRTSRASRRPSSGRRPQETGVACPQAEGKS